MREGTMRVTWEMSRWPLGRKSADNHNEPVRKAGHCLPKTW
nr:hypothetical protein [uncultured Chitinophaga sp.]